MTKLYNALKAIVDSTLGSGIVKRKPDSEGYYSEPLHKNELEPAQEALKEFEESQTNWSKVEPGTLIKVKDFDREPWVMREFIIKEDDPRPFKCQNTQGERVGWAQAELLTPKDKLQAMNLMLADALEQCRDEIRRLLTTKGMAPQVISVWSEVVTANQALEKNEQLVNQLKGN